jgi:photosystem II stability/assembly factor-like uncharacterized protein
MKADALVYLLSLAVLSCSAWPQGDPIHSLPAGPVERATMVAPNVGWAFGKPTVNWGALWWTTDGGERWRNITPPMAVPELIISACFIDTQVGWALLEDVSKGPRSFRFDLASTTSAGAKWEVHRLSIQGPGTENMKWGYITGQINFFDPLHGWMYLDSSNSPRLWMTTDGGRNWQPAGSPGPETGGGRIVCVTPQFAWLRDTFSNWLYVTKDGAKSWSHFTLPLPKELLSRRLTSDSNSHIREGQPLSDWLTQDDVQLYSDPIFQNSEHGFEVVTFASSKSTVPTNAVLFETLDGGVSWRAQSLLGDFQSNMSAPISSTVTDSTWLIARRPFLGLPMLTILHPGEWEGGLSGARDGAGYDSDLQMSFTTPDLGWLVMDGAILATRDGGASWSNVTPDRDRRKFNPGRLSDPQ